MHQVTISMPPQPTPQATSQTASQTAPSAAEAGGNPVAPVEYTLKDLFQKIIASRRLTRADQNRLLMMSATRSAEEKRLIDQIYERLRDGLIRVVD
jgi:hypothetical protein